MEWVTDTRLAELTGLTKRAIEARRHRGIWLENIHYVRAEDGRIWFSTRRIDEWAAQALKPGPAYGPRAMPYE